MRTTIQWLEKNRAGKKIELYKAFLEPKERELYDYLLGDGSLKVADVSQAIFGGSYKVFREAKDSLLDSIQDVTIMTARSASKRQQKDNQVYFDAYKMMIFLRLHSAQARIDYSEMRSIYHLAVYYQKLGIVPPALELLRIYRNRQLSNERKTHEMEEVQSRIELLLDSFHLRCVFDGFHQKLGIHLLNWDTKIEETLNEIQRYTDKAEASLQQTPNLFLNTSFYNVLGFKYLLEGKYQKAIDVFEEGSSKMLASKLKVIGGLASIAQIGLLGSLQLRIESVNE